MDTEFPSGIETWLGLLAVAGATLAAFFLARATRRALDGAGTLRLLRAAAVVYGVIVIVVTAVVVIGQLTSDVVDVALPTEQFWPVLPAGVHVVPAGAARVVDGGFTEALVSVTGLGWSARFLLAAGSLVQGLTQLAVTVAVFVLTRRLLAGEPFAPVLSRAVMVAAVALVAGGILWQLCFGIGQSIAANEALAIAGWGWDDTLVIEDPTTLLPQARVVITVQFWPIITGMALAAVAAAFRQGERLQADIAGLV